MYIDVHNLCIDFEAAYDTLWRNKMWNEMDKLRFSKKLVNLCRILNNEIYVKVKIGKHLSSEFKVNKGLRQGDAVAPFLLNIVVETAVRSFKVEALGTIFDKCSQIMAYADYVVVMGRRLQDVEVFKSVMNKQIRWD